MKLMQLTEFQHVSLLECANGMCDNYMLVRPNAADTAEQIKLWSKNNKETDALVQMGLLANVSEEFCDQIDAHFRASGRVFRMFRITTQGKAMFSEQSAPAYAN
jgi:hypothetical protein